GTGAPTVLTSSANVTVRWTGLLHVATTKTYTFRLYSDDGATLVVNNTVLTDCFGVGNQYDNYNCNSLADASIKLTAGDVPVEVTYYEQTGAAHVTLKWNDSGSFLPIPAASYAPGLGLLTKAVDSLGTTDYSYSDPTYQVRHLPSSVIRSGGTDPSRTTTYSY